MAERDAVTRYVDALLDRAAQRSDLPVTLLYRDPMPVIEIEGETLSAQYGDVENRLRAMCGDNLDEAGVGRFIYKVGEDAFVFDLTFRTGAEHSWCEVMVAPDV